MKCKGRSTYHDIVFVLLIAVVLAGCAQQGQSTGTPTPAPLPTTALPDDGCGMDALDDCGGDVAPMPAYRAIPGVYLGRFHGTRVPSVDLDAEIGKGFAVYLQYVDWRAPFNAGMYRANARVGRITHTTWEYKPGTTGVMADYEGRPLEAVVDGVFDDHIRSWAAGAAEFGKPIFLRWGHEMNGNWYPWGGANNGGGTLDGFGDPTKPDGPERFVAAYRHIHDIFAEAGADNVLWIWCPNAPFAAMEQAYGGNWNAVANYYPGDEYVDWLGFDGYNWGTSAYGQSFNSVWTSFDGIFAASYRELQALNAEKPMMIGEYASTEDGGNKAAWITDAYTRIREDYPQIRAVMWFHINKETDWRIDSSPESLAAFKQAVSDDYWLEAWPGMRD